MSALINDRFSNQLKVFWPKIVLKKWLNISTRDSDFSADDGDNESKFDEEGEPLESTNSYKLRRRNSETLRAQYINTKELKICVGTWNAGGRLPPDNLDITEWLEMEDPADIYVLGLQEIVPLNAGNIFGAEDGRPVPKWECLIRETLNRVQPTKPKYKCYSDPPSPSMFNPSSEAAFTVEELLPETDSDAEIDEKALSFPDSEEYTASMDSSNCGVTSSCSSSTDVSSQEDLDHQKHFSVKRLNRLDHFLLSNKSGILEKATAPQKKLMIKTLSSSERVGLVWPEQSLDVLAKCALSNSNSFKSVKSFRNYSSFKLRRDEYKESANIELVPDPDLDLFKQKKKRSPFVRIISKQMVGIFLSIWVRRSLRKHIQNLKVSTVGVGVMGYIGNKASFSLHLLAFIHLSMYLGILQHLSFTDKLSESVLYKY
uniref:Inositol polyphosphate-related phosphatase domain-containing protein n=1 Tax=Ananas comosus var. bracteatus TaxID=296719 RepID=A0A6V7QIU8_ANACO|nr:unnamed protein product [Ananas comosus var. bracteatus]